MLLVMHPMLFLSWQQLLVTGCYSSVYFSLIWPFTGSVRKWIILSFRSSSSVIYIDSLNGIVRSMVPPKNVYCFHWLHTFCRWDADNRMISPWAVKLYVNQLWESILTFWAVNSLAQLQHSWCTYMVSWPPIHTSSCWNDLAPVNDQYTKNKVTRCTRLEQNRLTVHDGLVHWDEDRQKLDPSSTWKILLPISSFNTVYYLYVTLCGQQSVIQEQLVKWKQNIISCLIDSECVEPSREHS